MFISDDTWGNISSYRIPREILIGKLSIEDYWRLRWDKEAPKRKERAYYQELSEKREFELIKKKYLELKEKLGKE